MRIKVIIHRAEEGGFWAEVPALPGCYSEGDTLEDMRFNIREAMEAILSIGPAPGETRGRGPPGCQTACQTKAVPRRNRSKNISRNNGSSQ